MRRLGIVGYGEFMQFFTPYLVPYFDEIFVCSRRDVNKEILDFNGKQVSLKEVASCEFVCIGVVAQYIEEVLQEMFPYLKKGTCIFDVCSVKEYPIEMMKKYIPKSCEIIATHPLFGSKSGNESIKGLNILLLNIRAKKKTYEFFNSMFKNMDLNIYNTSPDEHDKNMAYVQALSHFIAQGLHQFGGLKKDILITTKAYEGLLDVENYLCEDSWLLFESIEKYNKYAKVIRESFLDSLLRVNAKLDNN